MLKTFKSEDKEPNATKSKSSCLPFFGRKAAKKTNSAKAQFKKELDLDAKLTVEVISEPWKTNAKIHLTPEKADYFAKHPEHFKTRKFYADLKNAAKAANKMPGTSFIISYGSYTLDQLKEKISNKQYHKTIEYIAEGSAVREYLFTRAKIPDDSIIINEDFDATLASAIAPTVNRK